MSAHALRWNAINRMVCSCNQHRRLLLRQWSLPTCSLLCPSCCPNVLLTIVQVSPGLIFINIFILSFYPPKSQKCKKGQLSYRWLLHFWVLWTWKLLVKRLWNWPQIGVVFFKIRDFLDSVDGEVEFQCNVSNFINLSDFAAYQ